MGLKRRSFPASARVSISAVWYYFAHLSAMDFLTRHPCEGADNVIAFGERLLRHALRASMKYDNEASHLALAKDAPRSSFMATGNRR
jgi:hypothetical protein